jgi:hypothetical protein
MDRDSDTDLDLLLQRASRSALASLDAVVDVDRRWQELRRDLSRDPDDQVSDEEQ